VSTRPKRTTWRDWLPPGAPEPARLLTRDEVVRWLGEAGVAVTANDLRFWEQEGVLPHPVRQGHRGATRAVYPDWIVPLVERLRELQGQGKSLREIARVLRPSAILALQEGVPPTAIPLVFRNETLLQAGQEIETFAEVLRDFAAWAQRTYHTPPLGQAFVSFLDRDGQPIPAKEPGQVFGLFVPLEE
jgi:DNA-binding transcriptional MerR regulator